MASKQLVFDPQFISVGQATFKNNNVLQGDDASFSWGMPVQSARVWAFNGGTFSIDIQLSPNGNASRFATVATMTQAQPTIVVPGPIGSTLKCVVTAASAPVDLFVTLMETK